MTTTVQQIRFACRRRTAASWTSLNEVLYLAEIGLETDTGKFKFGDGVTAWNSLAYYGAPLWQPLNANLTRIAGLADPNADRILFWDDSAGYFDHLTLGTNLSITGTTLNASTSGGGVSSGTSNPGSPSSGDLFFRTDLGYLIFYDGTRWLTVEEFAGNTGPLTGITATNDAAIDYLAADPSFQMYATRFVTATLVVSNSTAGNGWVCKITLESPGASTLVSFDTRTTPDANNTWIMRSTAINSVVSSTAKIMYSGGVKNGSPGALYLRGFLCYRLIIT